MRDNATTIRWLTRIAENGIRVNIRRMRAQKRDRRRQAELRRIKDSISNGTLSLEPCDSAVLPGAALERGAERARVEKAISLLRPEYRDVILERDYAGGSWKTVAELIGSPSPAAARMLHARAMVELASRLRT